MIEALIALLLILALEGALIAKLSLENRMIKKKMKELIEKTRVIQEIYEWQMLQKKLKKESSKPRKRYIVFRILSENKISQEQAWEVIRRTVTRLYGEPFLKKSMLSLIYYDRRTQMGILRTTNNYMEHIIASLGIASSPSTRLIIAPVKTTGSIRKAKEYIY